MGTYNKYEKRVEGIFIFFMKTYVPTFHVDYILQLTRKPFVYNNVIFFSLFVCEYRILWNARHSVGFTEQ